jgi:hypothetical protein
MPLRNSVMEELRGWQACSPTGRLMALTALRRRQDWLDGALENPSPNRESLKEEWRAVTAAILLLQAASE